MKTKVRGEHIKRILIVVFILTLIDVTLTYLGINAGLIEEGNPLLAILFKNSPEVTSIAITCVVATFLFTIYKLRFQIKWLKPAMLGLVFIKVIVIGEHVRWIIAYTIYIY